MVRLRWLLSCAMATVLCCHTALATEPLRKGQESFLKRATFAEGRLWVLSDAGILSSIAEGESAWKIEALDDPVFDLCVSGDRFKIVTGDRNNRVAWALLDRAGGQWLPQTRITVEQDHFLALKCADDRAAVLTERRLIEITGDEQKVLPLSGDFGRSLPTVHDTPERIFVGFNGGEWGGGLYTVDRRTGVVAVVKRNNSGHLCGGPITPDCDPVTGIATVPWKQNCVAATIGLIHFESRGRIVEVCGEDAKRVYFKPYGPEEYVDSDGEPSSTVSFFGVTRSANSLWAVGNDGLYELAANGAPRHRPLPEFHQVDGIWISFEVPDLILVLTDINQRRSMSGSVPLLVPRNAYHPG